MKVRVKGGQILISIMLSTIDVKWRKKIIYIIIKSQLILF